jgi:3'-phosphoadenosine 5'-phosphosulfate sulfotransferase (PAPS reductase)/FAD synthetase
MNNLHHSFIEAERPTTLPSLATIPEIERLLREGAPVAIGTSGGKDSGTMALMLHHYLNAIGHSGPRLLIHSDLGRIEWRESIGMVERLAGHLGLDLAVVRRSAGGMVERWQQRWRDNVRRYCALSCVKLIMPWSSPSLRFCTSELKSAVIARALKLRYPGQTIINAVGLRREESPMRAKQSVARVSTALTTKAQTGYDWHPILDWRLGAVLASHEQHGFPLHPAYTERGSTRVSCLACVMSSANDLVASTSDPSNHEVYRELVALEITSTFSFQGDRWLGDVAPDLLTQAQRNGLAEAKERARARAAIEQRIPKHLWYTKGWPTCMPTQPEAVLLAQVRREVATTVGLEIEYATVDGVLARYAELLAQKAAKNGNCNGCGDGCLPETLVQEALFY